MKCFYHRSDLDGHCSGAIVKKKYPECEMIGVDYNDGLPVYSYEYNEDIYIVDFSFSKEVMAELENRHKLHWIDHHKSAIEKLDGFVCDGIREIGKSGCELTWEYIFPNEKMPTAVKLLGRYDVWDHKDPNVLPFQYGLRMEEDTLPGSDIWTYILRTDGPVSDYIFDYIHNGEIILEYERKQNEIYAKGMSYEAKFEGYRAIVINKAFQNSKIFDSVYDPGRHDIMILFGVKPGEFKYSLYSAKSDIDVSKIAVKYGGGGHAGAAAFYSKTQVV